MPLMGNLSRLVPSDNPGLLPRLKNRVFRVLRTPLWVRFQWAYNGPRTVDTLFSTVRSDTVTPSNLNPPLESP